MNSCDTWHGKYKDIATLGYYHALIRSYENTRNKECGEGCEEGWSGQVEEVWFGQLRDKRKN